MADSLRPYGPGKFDTILDSLVYAHSLDGCDEECGDVSENGVWYGLLRGPLDWTAIETEDEHLTPDERRYLSDHVAGCIIAEDEQGFVTVEYFELMTIRDRRWTGIKREIAEFNGDEPDEDSITTHDHRTFYQYGKQVLVRQESGHWFMPRWGSYLNITDPDDVEAVLRAFMDREQFWPTAFFISDHGNAHRIEL